MIVIYAHRGLSVVVAAVHLATIDKIAALDPTSNIMAPRYCKLFTVWSLYMECRCPDIEANLCDVTPDYTVSCVIKENCCFMFVNQLIIYITKNETGNLWRIILILCNYFKRTKRN